MQCGGTNGGGALCVVGVTMPQWWQLSGRGHGHSVGIRACSWEAEHSGRLFFTRCPLLIPPDCTRSKGTANPVRGKVDGSTSDAAARLDLGELESSAALYFAKGLADSTQKTYRAGENRFIHFCQLVGASPLPVSEGLLCKFVTYLARQGLKHRSLKTYLSGVRYWQIRSGYLDPFHNSHMPRLDYTMKGIKRVEAQTSGGQEGMPPHYPATAEEDEDSVGGEHEYL